MTHRTRALTTVAAGLLLLLGLLTVALWLRPRVVLLFETKIAEPIRAAGDKQAAAIDALREQLATLEPPLREAGARQTEILDALRAQSQRQAEGIEALSPIAQQQAASIEALRGRVAGLETQMAAAVPLASSQRSADAMEAIRAQLAAIDATIKGAGDRQADAIGRLQEQLTAYNSGLSGLASAMELQADGYASLLDDTIRDLLTYQTRVDLRIKEPADVLGIVYYSVGSGTPARNAEFSSDGTDTFAKIVFGPSTPAWNDPNHYFPGTGYVNIALALYFQPTLGGSISDLTNARLTFEMRLVDFTLPPGARMVPWAQGQDFDRGGSTYVNYSGPPIDEQLGFGSRGRGRPPAVDGVHNSGWRTVTIDFRPSDAQWKCMGSNPERTGLPDDADVYLAGRYGCMTSVRDFLAIAPKSDTGILITHPNASDPSVAPTDLPTGEIHVRRIKFETSQPRD